jgi:hypothetical protein
MDLLDNSMNNITICQHSFIKDYIDVDYGEKSICIYYCEKCLVDQSVIMNHLNSRSNLSISSNSVCTTSR